MENMYDAVIVGGGPAGLTAAIYLARANYKVAVIEKERIGGQITITSEVVNYPGVMKTSGTDLTRTMHDQALNFGAEFISAEVSKLKTDGDIKEITTTSGVFKSLAVILCTGANPRKVGFKGEKEFQGHGVAYCATCDGEFFSGMDLLVVGGGFAAVEESIFLTRYARSITVLVRKDSFSCARSVSDELNKYPNIKVKFNSELESISGSNMPEQAVIKNNLSGETVSFTTPDSRPFGVFVFAGYVPNTGLFKDIVDLDESGYVLTDRNQETSVKGVYAAGDLCVKNLRQVVTAVSDGAIAATSAEKHISKLHEVLSLPEFEKKKPAVKASEPQKETAASAPQEDGQFISSEIREQVKAVTDLLTSRITLKIHDDGSALASEIQGFVSEFVTLSDLIDQSVEQGASLPGIELIRDTGESSGIVFHAVPGGHEFNSFVLAVYNVAGPGQTMDDSIKERILKIAEPVDIKVMVSLSCTMCPEVVMGTQRIASLNSRVKAQVYDLQHFPDIKEKYQIMSVPCIVINDERVEFGKKNMTELLDLIGA